MSNLDRPLTESYWVKPGRFLTGEHPAVPEKKRTRKRLIKLLESGIDTFYDLTVLDESPAYLPILREEAKKLEVKIQHIRFPIMFQNVPPRGMMIAILDAIDSALAKERNVYLYCRDGIGGTGTTVGCFLVRHSLTGEQALKKLNELWKDVPKSEYFPQFTETNEQRLYVLNWWENLPTSPPSPDPPTRPAPKGKQKFLKQHVPSNSQQASWLRQLLEKLFQRKRSIQSQDDSKKDVPIQPMTKSNRPIRESYWVESGRFLAGEYPAAPYVERARERIGGLLDIGINTFIDLTIPNELPSYLPVLNEQARLRDMEAEYKRFPILDRYVPENVKMTEILDTLDGALAQDRKVYLHCWGGIGRTGTTVGCYLVRHGLTGEQAIAQLAEWWKEVPKSSYTPRSPETDRQVEFILKWDENSSFS